MVFDGLPTGGPFCARLVRMTEIIALIDTEIARLQQIRALIAGTAPIKRGPGRPRKASTATVPTKKKRRLTPEGRARIAAAVKARWAKQKKAAAK
jgi:hypothetical protein